MLTACATAFCYEPGGGVELGEYLKVGGYITFKYENGDLGHKLMADDIAVLAYGDVGTHTRYLVELENVGSFERDFNTNKNQSSKEFRIERAFVAHDFSSGLSMTVGKMITPVGFWNQTPINVLRDTTSSPLTATSIFPKLITGIQIHGDIPQTDDSSYSLAYQNNRDLDEEYNNFKIDRFFGAGAIYGIDDYSQAKIFAGSFRQKEEQKERRFAAIGYKYDKESWQVLLEAIYSSADKDSLTGGYLQTRYKLDQKNFLIARYENFLDTAAGRREQIGVFGYNYRPIYPVSFKLEYQKSSIADRSKFLCSVSALF